MIEHRHGIGEGAVALTFDDGPSARTEEILELLAEHAGTATFFAIGSHVAGREETVRQTLEGGSELGNHTFDHARLTELSEPAEIVDQLERATAAIEGVTGIRLRYWRAPYLASDERVRAAAAPLGLTEVGCSIVPDDYRRLAHETVERVLREIRPGSIVDLHDDEDNVETVKAVGDLLPELDRRGLRCVTVTELVALGADA